MAHARTFVGGLRVPIGAAIGAGLGYVLVPVAAHLGDGWIVWGLAGSALAAAALMLFGASLQLVRGLRENASGTLFALALPLLGLLLGGWIWQADLLSLRTPLRHALVDVAAPPDWPGAMLAGALAGLLVLAYAAAHSPWTSGAAFGLVAGAILGAHGDWTAGVWFVAPVVGALLLMLLSRAAVLACKARCARDPAGYAYTIAGVGIGALVGTVACGLCGLVGGAVATLGARVGLSHGVTSTLVDIFAVPDAITHVLGFGGGWLGGAGAGAALGAVIAGFAAAPVPVDLVLGAILGVVDHFTDGTVFRALLGDWRTGALTGGLVCGLTFLAVEDPPPGTDPVGPAAGFGLLYGAAVGIVVAWTGYGVAAAIAGGALGGAHLALVAGEGE